MAESELPDHIRRFALQAAAEPVAELICELPTPPGINQWWEPVSIRRGARSVASFKLSRAATHYKAHAEDLLLRQGFDVVALEDQFRDLWLQMHIISYLATPMERDVDGPLKPMQDLFCALLGANDARVRYASASAVLDPTRPRLLVRVEGYQVWDAGGRGGPFYMLRTSETPAGRRCSAMAVTARRVPESRFKR